jgi:hypothetical protein
MMLKPNNYLLIAIMMLIFTGVCAQHYPTNYFISPMDTPIYLSAPFGSLRENHFHSGMDIRTYEKEGLPIYAVADGYISRIKVSSGGYGKAVYIDHPNGFTSVYGHLLRYEGATAKHIKSVHYKEQKFEIDNFPAKNLINVKKGEIIGWSGNSGGSTGPHLHFEIRDTKLEEPINPQLLGITTIDLFEPTLKRLVVYNLENNKPIVQHNLNITERNSIKTDSGNVLLDTLLISKGAAGFGIEAYDYLVNENKTYSIYCADFFVDQIKRFSFRMDRVNFSETRFINAHIDYDLYKRDGYRIQKCFLDDGNKAQIYTYIRNKGKVIFSDTLVHTVHFCVGDFDGRSHTFYARVKATLPKPLTESSCNDLVWYPNSKNNYAIDALKITIPEGALYDTLNPCVLVSKPNVKGMLSAVYQIHTPNTPLHKSITISIDIDTVNIPSSKMLLANYKKDNSISASGGEYKNGKVVHQTSNFGTYCVIADTTAPVIKLMNLNKKNECSDSTKLLIKITDNMSGIGTYNGYINGSWLLLDYDAKNDILQYDFDENTIFNQKQDLQIFVTDKKGNTTTWKGNVIFKKVIN